MEDIIFDIIHLCKKNKLDNDEIIMLNNIFSNSVVDINHDNGMFILSSIFFENDDMVELLVNNGANIFVQNNKPYELSLQNNNKKYLKLFL